MVRVIKNVFKLIYRIIFTFLEIIAIIFHVFLMLLNCLIELLFRPRYDVINKPHPKHFYKLCFHGTRINEFFKAMCGFALGMFFCWLTLLLATPGWFTAIQLIIFTVLLSIFIPLVLMRSGGARNIYLITIPTMCSTKGIMILMFFIFSGPLLKNSRNFEFNLQNLANMVLCVQSSNAQLREDSNAILNQHTDINRKVNRIFKTVITYYNRTRDKVLEKKRELDRRLDELQARKDALARKAGAAKDWMNENIFVGCRRRVDRTLGTYENCIAKLEMCYSFQLGFWNILKPLGCFIFKSDPGRIACSKIHYDIKPNTCPEVDLSWAKKKITQAKEGVQEVIDEARAEVQRKIDEVKKKIDDEVDRLFNFTAINYDYDNVSSWQDPTTADISQLVINDIKEKFKIFGFIGTACQYMTILTFMISVLFAWRYVKKYRTKLKHDNYLITGHVRRLDEVRELRGLTQALPVSKQQSWLFLKPVTAYLSIFEWGRIIKSLLLLMPMTAHIGFVVLLDYGLYGLLLIIIPIFDLDQVLPVAGHQKLDVSGDNLRADYYGTLLEDQPGDIIIGDVLDKYKASFSACKPRPSPVNVDNSNFIGRIVGLCFLIAFCQNYALRTRSYICSYYYPTIAKERAVFMYNRLLATTSGALAAILMHFSPLLKRFIKDKKQRKNFMKHMEQMVKNVRKHKGASTKDQATKSVKKGVRNVKKGVRKVKICGRKAFQCLTCKKGGICSRLNKKRKEWIKRRQEKKIKRKQELQKERLAKAVELKKRNAQTEKEALEARGEPTLKDILIANVGFIRVIVGKSRKNCVSCGRFGDKGDYDNFKHCEGFDCDAPYCLMCSQDLNKGICIRCNQTAHPNFDIEPYVDSSSDEEELNVIKSELERKRNKGRSDVADKLFQARLLLEKQQSKVQSRQSFLV